MVIKNLRITYVITFNTLEWSNVFSYGPDNKIELSKYPLVQIIGKNGHGKSSIANILEELYYNTNSKKIARANVLNRYSGKSYSISGTFTKNNIDEYRVVLTRTATTTTLKLYKNGEDISSHTATATYKHIQEIIGYTHKAFTQVIYQTSAFGLEFLTATDTKRKEFLIELFNLTKYNQIGAKLKDVNKDISNSKEAVDLKIASINSWLRKYDSFDFTEKEVKPVPEQLFAHTSKIEALALAITNIANTNRKITQNNKYKEILAGLDIVEVPTINLDSVKSIEIDLGIKGAELARLSKERSNTKLISVCSSCGQSIDISGKLTLVESLDKKIEEIQTSITGLNSSLAIAKKTKYAYDKAVENNTSYEKYFSLIDKTLPAELLDEKALLLEKATLEKDVVERNKSIKEISELNRLAVEHNTKLKIASEQIEIYNKELVELQNDVKVLDGRLTKLQILIKAFSTNGLVAYKIESLIKDLEHDTNKYLSELSDGRFQLTFRLNSSDKLNVVIVDNGVEIDILALSNGERARVNVATLLAIRKVLQSLSDSKVNLLILDETIENLDDYGKEKLIEVLLDEPDLNTYLISHGFSHPLLEKINVVKENNISRIT